MKFYNVENPPQTSIFFGVISLFPEMFNSLEYSIPGRALSRGLISVEYFNPRDFTTDHYKTVDDRPYGGGPGMVMMAEPIYKAIQAIKENRPKAKTIYLSPQGQRLEQSDLIHLSQQQELILICGRYEGIDERIVAEEIDSEYSIGDYVISGGELAAMVIMDGITRLLPGSIGDKNSVIEDSFYQGLLDYPHYTRPEIFNNNKVPEVLLTGNHQAILEWRLKQSLGRTWLKRRDLLEKKKLSTYQQKLLASFINELGGKNE